MSPALTPLQLDLLLQLLIALVVTAVLSYFALRKWREEMAENIGKSMRARKAEKERLRSALAGNDDPKDSR
jgi:Protein of unknown function (DUF4229)